MFAKPFNKEVTQKEVDYFFKRIDKDSSPQGCWLWTGNIEPSKGYGRGQFYNETYQAHRISWYLHYGEPDTFLDIDHICHTEECRRTTEFKDCPHHRCVNPEHLVQCTNPDNVARTRVRYRSKLCVNGHIYTPETTYYAPGSETRSCRICQRNRDNDRYVEKHANFVAAKTHTDERKDWARKPKLSYDIADEIREKYKNGEGSVTLSREYQASTTTILNIVNNKSWVRGKERKKDKMDFARATEARRLYATGDYTVQQLSDMYGFKNCSAMGKILRNESWREA